MLTRVKDIPPIGEQPNINTLSPAAAARVTLEEQNRELEARLKEHYDACERGMTEKSAPMGQACVGEPPPHQLGTDISAGQGQGTSGTTTEGGPLIQMTPAEERFDQDRGLEIPGCWTTLMGRLEGRGASSHQPVTSSDIN